MESKVNEKQKNLNDKPSCSFSFSEEIVKREHCENILPKHKIEDEIEVTSDNCIQKIQYEVSENTNDFNVPDLPENYRDTYQAYINNVTALAALPIIKSVTSEYMTNFKHYNLRYYEDKYCINFLNSETGYNDVLIRIHSNKLFLVSLASGNDIIRCGKDITGINFMINNSDRSKVKLGGKRKKGAKVVESHTILCQVKCQGISKMFNIRAGVPGRIIEINEHVKNNPNLLRTNPKGYGYLAVVVPKGHHSNFSEIINNIKLLNEEEYIKYLTERTPKFSEMSEEILN